MTKREIILNVLINERDETDPDPRLDARIHNFMKNNSSDSELSTLSDRISHLRVLMVDLVTYQDVAACIPEIFTDYQLWSAAEYESFLNFALIKCLIKQSACFDGLSNEQISFNLRQQQSAVSDLELEPSLPRKKSRIQPSW